VKFLPAPSICVWELTLACNAACLHCGSSAGRARDHELQPSEALALCDDLLAMGVAQITLSGGEPLLRRDWQCIAARLVRGGAHVDMISNGLALDARAAAQVAESGMSSVTLSVDGTPEVHDALRGVVGSFRRLIAAAAALRAAGVKVGAATQVCSRNLRALEELETMLASAGFEGWQLQLTDPLGRCAQHPELPLAPEAVPEVVRFVLDARRRGAIPVYAADNIGWMPRCEPELRSLNKPADRVFLGCQAGLSVVGLTSDGTVRGCLSMPPEFDEGSLRDRPLPEIWGDPSRFAYNRAFREQELTGNCAGCAFKRICRGGCKSLAWAAKRDLSRNDYCQRGVWSEQ
jgi:radical SAM protein with 4Fe4S-binding SPASM domain